MSSFREQLIETARAFLGAHDKLPFDFDFIRSMLAEGATHEAGPDNIGGPRRNNEEYLENETRLMGGLSEHGLRITDMVVDEVRRAVVCYGIGSGKAGPGSYEVEVVAKLTMTEDGKKIVEHKTFVDSKAIGEFIQKMTEYVQARQQGGK